MKSNILFKVFFCNVLYLFYKEKVLRIGLEKKNWRGGFNIDSQFIKEAKNIVSKEYQ